MESNSVIVIGDVHGCLKTLKAIVAKFPKDIPIVFAGDLIDRGPDSAGVIDFVIDNNYKCVLGNHESMMMDAMDGWALEMTQWKRNGGDKCIANYGVKNSSDLESIINNEKMKTHKAWISQLPLIINFPYSVNAEGRQLTISHSSLHAVWDKNSHEFGYRESVLWNRLDNITPIPQTYNVFGHTPQKNGPKITDHYANIDTGCVFKDSDGYGVLTALQYPEMIVYTQENVEG
jgi:serine/threonine protein phosphatase 1